MSDNLFFKNTIVFTSKNPIWYERILTKYNLKDFMGTEYTPGFSVFAVNYNILNITGDMYLFSTPVGIKRYNLPQDYKALCRHIELILKTR